MELISMPTSLGLEIVQILKKEHNIEPRKNKSGLYSLQFSQTELDKITTLTITNPSLNIISGIEKLNNLETLTITTKGRTELYAPKDITSINENDLEEIVKIKNLKILTIDNQNDLAMIDVSKMSHLEKLNITNNNNLETIFGLEKLQSIKNFHLYNNKSLSPTNDLNKLMQNNNFIDLKLDLLLLPNAINYNFQDNSYHQETFDKLAQLGSSLKFVEALSPEETIEIPFSAAKNFHQKCVAIATDIKENTNSKIDIVTGIEKYLAENVHYDYQAITNESHTHSSGEEIKGHKIMRGPKGGANSAYNAIMLNTCICEGYTRAMQYLAGLFNLRTRNVTCIAKKDTLNLANGEKEDMYTIYDLPKENYHSIVNIEDIENLYCDPCYDAFYYQKGNKTFPFLLLNKKQIAETHTLPFSERVISNEHIKIPRQEIEASLLQIENNNQKKR